MSEASTASRRRVRAFHRPGLLAAFVLLAGLAWAQMVAAVGLPSTYPGCANRTATVSWGGNVNVDLSTCHFFGLGAVSTSPTHGSATPGPGPVNFYTYAHGGSTPAGGGTDTFVVLDDNSDFITITVTINPPTSAIVVTPGALPTLTAGTPASQTLSSSGGLAPYTYTLQSGVLPVGMSLTSGGVISGTPTQRGPYSFTVRSTDSTTPTAQFVDRGYSGTVQNPSLTLVPNTGTAIQSVPFSLSLSTSGGVAPHSYLLETGTFPAGISINGAGVISGTTAAAPGNYPVTLRVTDASTGPGAYFELEPFTLTVSPPPSVTIAVSPASVSEDGATNLTYTVTRSLNLSSPTVVNITTGGTATAGVDYTGSVATVTIPAGATTATVVIDPNVDGTVEADETVVLSVAAGTGYSVGAPASATGTILNDDVPSATISVSPAAVAEDGAPNLIYTVTLNQASLSATSVNFTIGGTAANGTDYATIASPLVIPPGNTTGTVTVNPTADVTIEADETVILTLAAGTGYTVGVPNSATGTILNDDLPNLTINDVTANEGNAGSTNFTFTVSLSAPAGPGGVTFSIATANGSATAGSDYVAQSLAGQTIPAGSSTYTFTVQVSGDTLNEPSENFFVNVTSVVNAVVVDGQGVGTIVNDDPLPSLSINDVTVVEGNAGITNAVFTVSLSALSGQTVTVNFATADGTATQPGDYTAFSGVRTFNPGQSSQTITVPVIGETVPEANETFFVNLSGATNATISDNQGVGTITNDDVPVTVSPASLPGGTVAAAYSQSVSASGGVAPYTFAVTAGSVPTGLSLSPAGVLSGTPTAGGSFNFTITATDSSPFPGPFSGSQAYTLTVAPPTITLPATALAGGTLGAGYTASIAPATGGTAPYSYAVTAGALPGGLTLNAATGAITGTPSAIGTFNFSVTATDSSTGTGPYTATQSYAITVIDVPPVAANSSLTVAYNAAATNVPLSLGGGAPTSLAVTAAPANGTVVVTGPNTLTYQPDTGYAGPDSFSYTATNTGGTSAPATVTVTVNDPVVTITAGGPLTGTVAVAYSQTFTFGGGAQPWSAYQVTNLPAGLAITGSTANTVTILGTPTQAGTFNLNVSGTDSSTGNGPYTVGQSFALTINGPVLTMTPAAGTLNAPYGAAFTQAFAAAGGTGPYTYALTGALPAGMAFAGDTLSGTPTAPGSYPVTVTATDTGSTGTGAPFTIAQNYTINVPAPTITVDPATLPNPTAAQAYAETITATGGIAPYTFAVTAGTLPNGLTLATGGALSGSATEVGTFNFTVTATDNFGQTGSRAYTVTVSAPVLTMTPAAGTLNAPYATAFSQAFTASGGSGSFSYTLTGALPAGMGFAGNTLSGTPTVPGSYPVTVTATDTGLTGAGAPFSIAQNYTIDVPAPTITLAPGSVPNATAGAAYSQAITASGGVAPYTYAVTAGALPSGLTLGSGGALTGTPTASGTFNFTVTATDNFGQTGSQAFSLTVDPAVLAIAPATLPDGIVGVAYSQTVSASNGVAPYTYAVSAGALPTGLTLSPAGALTGTPTAAGNFSFTITATDSTSGTASTGSQAYTVEIVFAPPVANNDTATVLAGQSVTIPVTANDVSLAPITAIAIATGPAQGTATVSGLDVVYTAPTLAPPTVSFTYIATGPGGSSAPATVTVTVNPLPIPTAKTATTASATPVTVDITAGATGGPFTAAAVVSIAPAGSGTATVAPGGSGYLLTFTPDPAFVGVSTVQFTVSNAFATSPPTTLTVTVQPRPDPSRDPEVIGLIDAQAEASRRFATSQIANFQQRLERLHRGGGGSQNSLGFASDPRCLEPLVGYSVAGCDEPERGAGNGLGAGGNGASGGGDTSPFGAWIGGAIRSGTLEGRAGRADLDFETDGVSAGVDYRISPSLVIGAGLGWAQDDTDVGPNGSRSEARARTLAAYGSWHPGNGWYVDGVFGLQKLRFDLRRNLTGTSDFVSGQRDGDQWFGSVTTGADLQREAMLVSPYLRLDLAKAQLDAYTETGHPILALAYAPMDVETAVGTLGLRMDWRREIDAGVFTPQLRLEYQRDFSARTTAEMVYADLPGGPGYGVAATRFDRNRFVLGLGALFDLEGGWHWRLEYRGSLGAGEGDTEHGIGVNLQKDF